MGIERKPLYKGEKFGRLTVIEKDVTRSEATKRMYYLVQCSCGSPVKSILKSTLLDKRRIDKSCGCLVKEKAGYVEDRELAMKKLIYGKIKERHVKKLLDDEEKLVSFDIFKNLVDKCCHYCGKEKTSYYKDRSTNYVIYYNGLDRVDSSLGYRENNVVPACKGCNIAKTDMNEKDFKEYIIRLHNYQQKNGGESLGDIR
ncbi:Marine sediment metagenome DNA, contig: S01H1_S06060 [Bacillus cereus]|nr:Marine sediment metagenome DNA, contig: S01H1_S06060 [Bacillus cereus]